MKKSELFERLLVEAIVKRIENSKMSHAEFGRRVFGKESGVRIWRATREEKRKRGLGAGEVYMIAEVLNVELPAFLWEVMLEIKDRLN